MLQDFTEDRDALTKVDPEPDRIGDTGMANGSTGDDSEADTGAAYTADDTEFNIFNTDRKLAALESAVKMLGSLAEKKALVYFASGMTRTGIDNQAQLRATVNAAIRSNVAFYPVDARGLVATAPLGDATQGSQGGQGMYSGSSQRTGAKQLPGTAGNALHAGLRYRRQGAARQQRSLAGHRAGAEGYLQLLHPRLLQHQHRPRRTLPAHQGADRQEPQAPSSTTARATSPPRNSSSSTSSDRERQLQEALMLGDPVTDLTVALEVNYFRLARDRYFVPVSVKIPGSDIELARKGGAESTRLDFIGEVKDSKGVLQGTVRDDITVKLKGETAGQLASAQPGIRHRLHAAARHLHPEIPGARERDRQDGDLRNQVRDSGPDRGTGAICRSAPWC